MVGGRRPELLRADGVGGRSEQITSGKTQEVTSDIGRAEMLLRDHLVSVIADGPIRPRLDPQPSHPIGGDVAIEDEGLEALPGWQSEGEVIELAIEAPEGGNYGVRAGREGDHRGGVAGSRERAIDAFVPDHQSGVARGTRMPKTKEKRQNARIIGGVKFMSKVLHATSSLCKPDSSQIISGYGPKRHEPAGPTQRDRRTVLGNHQTVHTEVHARIAVPEATGQGT